VQPEAGAVHVRVLQMVQRLVLNEPSGADAVHQPSLRHQQVRAVSPGNAGDEGDFLGTVATAIYSYQSMRIHYCFHRPESVQPC
jgi:hypothetical protein